MREIRSILFIFFISFSFSIYAAHSTFTAYLTGDQETPQVVTNAKGTAAITMTPTGGIIYVITVNGLSGAITGAHFHVGGIREAGPVVYAITPTFTGTTASGLWANPPDSIIAAMMTGRVYVNVHTAANPGGEIRGQVNLSSGTYLSAFLTGAQEVPSVTTTAKGTASFVLSSAAGVGLAFHVTVNGLSGAITGAHIHLGPIGSSGPVVFPLNVSGNTASGIWRTAPGGTLNDTLIAAILTGNTYINFHTAANPGGEIRGQIMPSAGFGFNAAIDGSQEVPPVSTNAKGTGFFNLTDYGLVFSVTTDGLSGPVTAAHFHNASSGISGPVVKDIFTFIVGNKVLGLWKTNDAQPLTNALIKELFTEKIYINFHTAANPGGEIRGQLTPVTNNFSGAGAMMSGNQEVNPVTTNATGTAYFILSSNSLEYRITVNGLSGPMTGAHFHYAGIREPGGIVKDITGSFSGNTATGFWLSSDPQPFNDSLRAALYAGKLYVNVHTSANPGGEIRGQVIVINGSGMRAMMTGLQEVPSVTTTASGTGNFTLTSQGLGFNVTFTGLSGAVTGAHFHYGYAGQSGPVIKNLLPYLNGNTISGYWGEIFNTDSLFTALLSGRIYINVHTAANPGGEIRGQVLLSEGIGLTAQMNGAQEVPPVTSTGRGTGAFTLTDMGVAGYVSMDGLSGPVTGMHFHNAAIGTSGPVVKNLTSMLNGTNYIGSWTKNETTGQNITNTLFGEIITNNVYVNAHTSVNPNGEIRGQLMTGSILVIGIKQISGEVPVNYALYQNYPNPFNPVTTIKFSIPSGNKGQQVSLIVYNSIGQAVETLVDKEMTAGTYEVTFDASKLASGIYFYYLMSNNVKIDTKKMVLVK